MLQIQDSSIIKITFNIFKYFLRYFLTIYFYSGFYSIKLPRYFNYLNKSSQKLLNVKILNNYNFKFKKLIVLNSIFFSNFLHNLYGKHFFKILNILYIYSLLGQIVRLDVIGYIRQSWYLKKKRTLLLSLGFTCYNFIILSKKIFFKISKKRLFFFFSNNIEILQHYVTTILKFKPTDSYKIAGLIYHKQEIKLKKSKKQRVGTFY